VRLERAAPHERPERRRPDDRARAELDERPDRDEVRPQRERRVRQAAGRGVPDRRALERRRRPVGEPVGAQQRVVGVRQEQAGRERGGGQGGRQPGDRGAPPQTITTGRW
jgi:hypothetical protein